METIERKTHQRELENDLFDLRNMLAKLEGHMVMKFDYDPIRYRLHLDCFFSHEYGLIELTMEGIYNTRIKTRGDDLDASNPAYDLTDVGSVLNNSIPKGCLNPPHLYFQIGLTHYSFWGSRITIDGDVYDFETIRIADFEREKLGVSEDWQPPVRLEE